jgi:hypothetical protein
MTPGEAFCMGFGLAASIFFCIAFLARDGAIETLKRERDVALASVDYHQGIVRQYEACVDEPEQESARLVTIQ